MFGPNASPLCQLPPEVTFDAESFQLPAPSEGYVLPADFVVGIDCNGEFDVHVTTTDIVPNVGNDVLVDAEVDTLAPRLGYWGRYKPETGFDLGVVTLGDLVNFDDSEPASFLKYAAQLDYIPSQGADVATYNIPIATVTAPDTSDFDTGSTIAAVHIRYCHQSTACANQPVSQWRTVPEDPLEPSEHQLRISYQDLDDPDIVRRGLQSQTVRIVAIDEVGNQAIKDLDFMMDVQVPPLRVHSCGAPPGPTTMPGLMSTLYMTATRIERSSVSFSDVPRVESSLAPAPDVLVQMSSPNYQSEARAFELFRHYQGPASSTSYPQRSESGEWFSMAPNYACVGPGYDGFFRFPRGWRLTLWSETDPCVPAAYPQNGAYTVYEPTSSTLTAADPSWYRISSCNTYTAADLPIWSHLHFVLSQDRGSAAGGTYGPNFWVLNHHTVDVDTYVEPLNLARPGDFLAQSGSHYRVGPVATVVKNESSTRVSVYSAYHALSEYAFTGPTCAPQPGATRYGQPPRPSGRHLSTIHRVPHFAYPLGVAMRLLLFAVILSGCASDRASSNEVQQLREHVETLVAQLQTATTTANANASMLATYSDALAQALLPYLHVDYSRQATLLRRLRCHHWWNEQSRWLPRVPSGRGKQRLQWY